MTMTMTMTTQKRYGDVTRDETECTASSDMMTTMYLPAQRTEERKKEAEKRTFLCRNEDDTVGRDERWTLLTGRYLCRSREIGLVITEAGVVNFAKKEQNLLQKYTHKS